MNFAQLLSERDRSVLASVEVLRHPGHWMSSSRSSRQLDAQSTQERVNKVTSGRSLHGEGMQTVNM